ncbi:MAG: hypothetical protein J6J01_05255 [Oscillospiraceae bacterium]|nr:hypothetical protein [Oscillospiraceae bacterium]MBP3698870.1 hypothetical protein [Oscillospiraceae bacterium]
MKREDMFNEKSNQWIKIFKGYTKVMFWICIVVAVVLCILGWCDWFWLTGSVFIDGLILLACGVFAAFVQLVVNMLIIQYLNNVQVIREKVEKM